jgi:hypothetical protein
VFENSFDSSRNELDGRGQAKFSHGRCFGLWRETERRAALDCAELGEKDCAQSSALGATQSGVAAALYHRTPYKNLKIKRLGMWGMGKQSPQNSRNATFLDF